MGEDRIKETAELREILEERIQRLETELSGLKTILKFVNEELIKKSFRKIEPPKTIPQRQKKNGKSKKGIELKTTKGVLLANIYLDNNIMKIITAKDKKFDANTPPFEAFFIKKVLSKMKKRDQVDLNNGTIKPEEALNFSVKTDTNIIKEIIVQNISPERKQKISSAARWTLEKMYEKINDG